MIRLVPFAFATIMTLIWADSSWAQQKGTTGGQPPTTGQTPPATQINPAGIQNSNQLVNPAGIQTSKQQVNPAGIQNPIHYGPMNQTPFFTNQGVQKQLKLTQPQMKQLQQSYGDFWGQYIKDQTAAQVNKGKSNTAEMATNFSNQMLRSAQGILDPTQYLRFRQLHWQGQGFNVFNDPTVIQSLKLTADQQTKIRAYAEQQNQSLNSIFGSSSTDPQVAAKEYEKLRLQHDQYLNSLLTPQQQQELRSLLGGPYDFSPYAAIKK
jgi:Spy/CpxP family protein refolding chaperone